MTFKNTVVSLLSVAWIAVAVQAETITVTNTDAMGYGSLSAAIEEANSDRGMTTIKFDIPVDQMEKGVARVNCDFLPDITTPVVITDAFYGPILLEGSVPSSGGPTSGLVFKEGSDNSKVNGIRTEKFRNAIEVHDSRVTIMNCSFNNPYAHAIYVKNGNGSSIIHNTFRGESQYSAVIENSTGVAFLANAVYDGEVQVRNSVGTVIGATGAGQGNVFSGNGSEAGVVFYASDDSRFMNNHVINQPAQGVAFKGSNNSNVAFNTFARNIKGDIALSGGDGNNIFRNTITGDSVAREAGIELISTKSAKVTGNTIDAARITVDGSQQVVIGGIMSDGNIIKNDPVGFSGSAAVVVNNSNEVNVINNEILDNASHGILIENGASNGSVYANTITGNGRSGIKAVSGENNSFSQNVITGQNAAAAGGVNSISLVGSANNQIESPVITSVTKTNNEIHVSGTTSGINDKVEIFASSESDNGIALMTDAAQYATVAFATDTTWSVSFSATNFENAATIYLTATATDVKGNTSELSFNEKLVVNEGLSGSETVTAGVEYTYEVAGSDAGSYQWWLSGDANIISGAGTNKITVVFNTSGSISGVNVGYSDSVKGWVSEKLNVIVD